MALRATISADFSEFSQALQSVDVKLKTTADYAKNAGRDLAKMVEGFSGSKLFRDAELTAEAVTRIGGASKLTESEQRRVNAAVTEAIAKYRALGQEVPPHLEKIAAETKSVGTATTNMGSGLSKLQGLAGTLGIAFSATAVVSFGKALLDDADALVKLSDKTGIAIEPLQRLKYVAEQSGNSLEQVTSAVSMMQRRLADGEKDAAAALDQLGISFEDLKAMSPDRQFETIAIAVGKIEDPMQRAKVATDLFGRSGAEVLPTLVSDFKALGDEAPKMSEKATRAFDSIGDAWNRTYTTLKNKIGEGLAMAFDSYARLAEGAGEMASGQFGKAAETFLDLETTLPRVATQAKALQVANAGVALSMDEADRIAKELDGQFKTLTATQAKSEAAAKAHAEAWKRLQAEMYDVEKAQAGAAAEAYRWGRVLDEAGDTAKVVENLEALRAKLYDIERVGAGATLEVWKFGQVLDEAGDAGKAAEEAGKRAAESFGAGLKDIAKNFGSLMADAIINGDWRNAFTALGSQIGELLGQQLGKKLGDSIGGMLGDVLGSILPGLGSMLGPLVTGLWNKITDAEHRQVNDLRDAWEDQYGTLEDLNKKAQEVGLTLDKYLAADTVEEYTAAIQELEAAFAKLDAAAQEYGLTWRDMTAEGLSAGFADDANALLDNFNLLVGAGYDVDKVMAAMADDLNALLLDAAKYGQKLPAAMQPMIDKMVELGLISDEVAAVLTGNANAVDAATKQATAAMQAQFDALQKEYDGLAQSIANEAPEEVMGVVETQTRARMDAIKQEQDALQASMDAAEEEAKTTAEALAQALKDIFADPVKVNIDWGEPPDWWEQIHGGITGKGGTGEPGGTGGGPGGGYGGPQASGGDYLVSRPTWFLAGEAGLERATFTPMGKSSSAAPIIITVVSQLDGREVARNQVRYLPNQLALAGV